MSLATTAQGFQTKIAAIASAANMQPEQVYELWRKYDRQCSSYDQSPVLFEFIEWYAADMGGNRLALKKALDDEEEFQAHQDELDAAYEESIQRSYQARGQACLY